MGLFDGILRENMRTFHIILSEYYAFLDKN